MALTMEEMAAHHIAVIQKHTPHGPYVLGGYCIGAIVAAEVARQLVVKGETVHHVLMIDPTSFDSRLLRRIWPVVDTIGNILKWDLQKKIHCFDRYGVSLNRWTKKSFRSKFGGILNRLGLKSRIDSTEVAEEENDAGDDGDILDSLDYEVYMLAFRRYTLRPLSVPTTLYLPKENPPARAEWTKHAHEIFPIVTLETVPGNHRTCIIEHTSALVDKMKKTLDGLKGP